METLTIWQLVRAGFWIGVGFLVPSALLGFASMAWVGYALSSFDPTETLEEIASPDFDDTEGLELGRWRTAPHGKRLLILGSVRNTRDSEVGSVQVEAEFFDVDGAYVYECSEYIRGDLQPGATENYQITCGCRNASLPDHERIEVRIVSASTF